MRMNGWVRCKASTQAAWFCPKCGDKWSQGAGSSRRWILLWENGLEFDETGDKEAADPDWPQRHGSAWVGGQPGEAASKPKTWAEVQKAKGRAIIYEYGDDHGSPDGNFCENAFTYLKRVSLCTSCRPACHV
eukprot:3208014-Amphidinium_carterae.1